MDYYYGPTYECDEVIDDDEVELESIPENDAIPEDLNRALRWGTYDEFMDALFLSHGRIELDADLLYNLLNA